MRKILNGLGELEKIIIRQLRDPAGENIIVSWENGPIIAKLKVMEVKEEEERLKIIWLFDEFRPL